MPKKNLSPNIFKQQSKDLRQAAKYHWEFKRRNAVYRLWWQDGAKEEVKPEGWDERFNPDLSFEELIKISLPEMEKENSGHLNSDFKKAFDKAPAKKSVLEFLFFEKFFPKSVENKMSPDGSLTIKIHYDKIRSVSALRKYISYLIDTHHKMFKTQGVLTEDVIAKLGRTKNLNRDFDKILEAGDMKEKNLTEPQIARKLYPKDVDREGAKIKVHQLLKEYKKLVNGGYEEIAYP